MNSDRDDISADDPRWLAILTATTAREPSSPHSEQELPLRETYAGFARAMAALERPIDVDGLITSVCGEVPSEESIREEEVVCHSPKAKSAWRRLAANPWAYGAVAALLAVVGITWMEIVPRVGTDLSVFGDLLRWNGYGVIDQRLDEATSELAVIRHEVPIAAIRPVDEMIDSTEVHMNDLLHEMGLVPL